MNLELAKKYAPYIYFDKKEPFFPLKIGVTVFDKAGDSPSFSRHFDFSDERLQYIIEYAIYWDFDIQHLYELEHFWVYVGKDGTVIDADASFHGKFFKCLFKNKRNIADETHVVIYSQPGKHAFMPSADFFEMIPNLLTAPGKCAGSSGLIITNAFKGCYTVSPEINKMVRTYLQRFAFEPSLEYEKYEMPEDIFITWEELYKFVPKRISYMLDLINKELPCIEKKNLVIFIDSGDTIIDEGTEIRNEAGEVVKADGIPGAFETLKTLHSKGYRLCLVADGLAQSFKNMFIANGIYDLFEALIYSEPLKIEKPHARMFKAAMGAMELTETDLSRIIMVGNNLSRDVKGANAMGITSVFLDWTPRYPKTPADDSEKPDYTIHMPMELIALADQLNESITKK